MIVQESMGSLAGRYTKLVFHGATKKYHGKCPFCHSGTNTFCADNKKAIYWCYACGKHGTLEDFEISVGLKQPELEPEYEDEALQTVYETAAAFYYQKLLSNKHSQAYRYIVQERGLPENVITDFGIGYAPKWSGELYEYLKNTCKERDIRRSGLIKTGRNGQPYDMFRDRIMFPILNRNGRVVAFGGRCLEGTGGPKYLNSAESRIFNKHSMLYGFTTAMQASKTHDKIVICEGYMDLIALQMHGIPNSSAVLGTALTEDHANMLRHYYKTVMLALDSDEPGLKAAARSIPILKNAGLQVSVLNFKPAKDPDEFLKTYGTNTMLERMDHGMDPSMFLVRASQNPESEFIKQVLRKM